MFLSIGNSGPGVNTAGDPGLCDKVMGMGAYLTDDTMLADYGVRCRLPGEPPYLQLARAARGRRLLADGGRAGRRDQHDSAVAATGLPGADVPGRVRARQRDLDGIAAIGRRWRAPGERGERERRAGQARAGPAGAHVERPVHHRGQPLPGLRPGRRAARRERRVGSPAHQPDAGDHHRAGREWLADFRVPRGAGVGNGIYDREDVTLGEGVHTDVHVHPDRWPRRLEDVQRHLGRQ